MTDLVNHPPHYTHYSVEVIEIVRYLPTDLANTIKYVVRSPFKGSHDADLDKALWYLRDYEQHPLPFTLTEDVEHKATTLASEIPDGDAADAVIAVVEGRIADAVDAVNRMRGHR